MAPNPPYARGRPGGAVTALDIARSFRGAPIWPPNPPTLGPPRRSRDGPRHREKFQGGPDMARLIFMGAPTWPPTPLRSGRPGGAVTALDIARSFRGAPIWPA